MVPPNKPSWAQMAGNNSNNRAQGSRPPVQNAHQPAVPHNHMNPAVPNASRQSGQTDGHPGATADSTNMNNSRASNGTNQLRNNMGALNINALEFKPTPTSANRQNARPIPGPPHASVTTPAVTPDPSQRAVMATPAVPVSVAQNPTQYSVGQAGSSGVSRFINVNAIRYPDANKSGAHVSTDLLCASNRSMNQAKILAAEWNITEQQANSRFGLRTGFAQQNDPVNSGSVKTNHLRLTPPKEMFVYTINMIRAVKENGEDIIVKQLDDKRKLWAHALHTIRELRDNPHCWATDYTLLWTVKPLFDPRKPHEVANGQYVNDGGVLLDYDAIRIIFKEKIDCHLPTAALFQEANGMSTHNTTSALLIRGLNAFLTKHARQSNSNTFIGGNKAFANALSRQHNLTGQLYALQGFFLSARPGIEHMYLNINTATSAFYQEFQVDILQNALGLSNHQMTKMLKGVKLILDEAAVKPNDSVVRYFVQVGRSVDGWVGVQAARDTRQKSPTAEWYRFEDIWIQRDQRFPGILTPDQTSAMIKVALHRPADNVRMITGDGLNMFGFKNSMFNTQVTVGTQLMVIPATWLTPPVIKYGTGPGKAIQGAQWNLRDDPRFSKPQQVTNLRYLNLSRHDSKGAAVRNILQQLTTKLSRHGARNNNAVNFQAINNTPNISSASPSSAYEAQVVQVLKQIPESQRPASHLLILIQKHDFELYAYIKRVAELKLGIKTIFCVVKLSSQGTQGGFSGQNASNIALKFNLKSSGSNHYLQQGALASLKSAECIVLGADVTHPGPGAHEGTPSIAAVVGSTDDEFMHFPGSMRLQRSRKEEIVELGDMVKERLIDWALKHGNKLPKKVLFYRDGVSESQYAILRNDEIPQIKMAFKWAKQYLDQFKGSANFKLANSSQWPETGLRANTKDQEAEEELLDRTQGEDVDYELTYVVVGKRHNVRFYPDRPQDGDRNGNVHAGMVVDQVITHPTSFDFYLQSHAPIQGTGRSAHYYVLTNGMNLSTSALQNVTHAFCYAYAVATRGVSYCAPAYYADRLCDRGRMYLRQYLTHKEGYEPPRRDPKKQSFKQFNKKIKDDLRDDAYWRNFKTALKYGVPRRNPWHPNMDDVMFYL